ncbi:MAG: hypothetical protein ACOX2F_08580 [bacterium]
MRKILVLILLFVSTLSVFAVNDHPDFGCEGIHNLDNLFVEVYWKEGLVWYKIPNHKMNSIYPWKCMLDNSCGGYVPWGESHTCYIYGHVNDKVVVSESSVPCLADYANIRSCWVWKDINWGSDHNIYRIVIPVCVNLFVAFC